MSTTPQLFTGLVDDAAMFPPGNAEAGEAIAEHLRYRRSWFADLIGPLLVPARAWPDFCAAHAAAGSPSLAVVVIGTTTLPDPMPPGVTVAGFEAVVPDAPLPAVPEGCSLAAEVTADAAGLRVMRAVAQARDNGVPVVAKFRTGGTVAEAFPSEGVLAQVLSDAVEIRAPLKLTAGLHQAVRHTDPTTGFEHHGFLNVMAATRAAMTGADVPAVAAVLARRDPAALLPAVGSDHDGVSVRTLFVSFGCCGVEDPVHDLLDLGLVGPPPDHPEETP